MASKSKLKEFFRTLAGQSAETDGTAEDSIQDEAVVAADQQPSDPAESNEELFLPFGDNLMQVWRKWNDTEEPPSLSLTENLHFDAWCSDRQMLERETAALSSQLEQNALRRLQELQVAEIRNVEYLNADCQVYVSKDKMVAWLFMFPPMGEYGSVPSGAIESALKAAKVTAGIDYSALARAEQEKLYFHLIPVAMGTLPVEGTDGSVIERFSQTALKKEVEIDEKGIADFKSANNARQVIKGDVICDIVPAVPGQAGQRVDGVVAEPRRVKNPKVPRGTNTTITDDGLRLIATIDGHLDYANGAFQVRPVLVIDGDVDYNVGNIDFKGDVQIRGDVRESFTVLATGSIVVEGHVEAATVKAGGDLRIKRGVVGDDHALLKCGGVLQSKYLENCKVYAWKGVISECIINSKVYSDTTITVTSGRGSIIGGELKAAQSIKANVIGTEAGKRMDLFLGVLPCAEEELENISAELEEISKENAELNKILPDPESTPPSDREDAQTAKARMRKSVLDLKAQKLQERREYIETLTTDPSKSRLEGGTVYPITAVKVKNAELIVRETTKQFKVKYDEQTKELTRV